MVMNFSAKIPGTGYNDNFSQKIYFHEDDSIETEVVNIYPEIVYEVFEGFGGAITEAAGYVYSLMSSEQKKQLLETYFSPDNMNYQFVRIHMDSCDFCFDTYEAMSDSEDTLLDSFSFERTQKYILPMLDDAQQILGKPLKIMLSPWSPPAFMKTNGERKNGGHLIPQYRQMWAAYICRYIQEFRGRGYNVQRISIQNESAAPQKWDSCVFSAEEEKIFLKEFLYPEMVRKGFQDIEIFIWDHNKERLYERVRDTLDSETRSMIKGVAFHWYSGNHFEAMDLVKNVYPELKLIMSESCIEYRIFTEEKKKEAINRLCHEVIGDLKHGMNAFYDWNLLLDEQGGPNYAGNFCHAPFLYDTVKKKLLPQNTQHIFYQFAHYIQPGYRRIATTKYTEKLDVVGYKAPEGKIVIIVWNKHDGVMPIVFRMNGKTASLLMPGKTLGTCVIE